MQVALSLAFLHGSASETYSAKTLEHVFLDLALPLQARGESSFPSLPNWNWRQFRIPKKWRLKNSDRNVLNMSWPIVWRWLPVGFRLPVWWPLGQVPQALEFYLCSLLWKSGWWYFKAFTVAVLRTGLTNAKISSKPYSSYRWCLETGKFGSHDDFRIHAFWWALLSLGAGCCLKSVCCCPCW